MKPTFSAEDALSITMALYFTRRSEAGAQECLLIAQKLAAGLDGQSIKCCQIMAFALAKGTRGNDETLLDFNLCN